MSINFPSAPAAGDRFTSEGRTFRWNGAVWLLEAAAIPWASLADMDAATAADKIVTPAGFKHIAGSEIDAGGLYLRAWARFDGNSGAIQASFNVAGITLQGTASYRVDFTTPMPDADYLIHSKTFVSETSPLTAGINVVDAQTANSVFLTTGQTGGQNSVWLAVRGAIVHLGVFHPAPP